MSQAAVIMAGGSGTRLWPLSRRGRPKQLLRIIQGRSLLRLAFERLRAFLPPESIHVIALAEHLKAIAKELPELPADNLIGEPAGRDTANAIALAAAILHHREPDTTMGVFTADHLIRPTDRFCKAIQLGFQAAEARPDDLVTFGIRPTSPHIGYGYVQRGDLVQPGVWSVRAFKEKPAIDTARAYVDSGDYYWNSGMFVWRTGAILDQLREHLPATHAAATRLAGVWKTDAGQAEAAELYPTLDRVSIDYAVMEKAAGVLVVEMDLAWIDVGSWPALAAVLGTDADGNTNAAEQLARLSSRGNVFVSEDDHLIAAIGVEDLIIVHSRDATLICRRDQAERIKELTHQLKTDHGERYT